MRDRLLKEAIADAKDLRDIAIAQAKSSLEEALKPGLSKALAARLKEEVGTGGNNEMGKTMNSSDIGATAVTVKDPGPKEPSNDSSDSSHIKNVGLEFDVPMGEGIEEFGHEHEEHEEPQFGAPAGDPNGALDVDVHPDGMGGEEAQFGDMGGDGGELDLDAIIRELELDVNGGQEQGAEGGFGAMGTGAMDGMGAQEIAGDVHPKGGFQPSGAPPGEDLEGSQHVKKESFSDPMAGAKVRGPLDGSLKEDAEGCLSDGKSPKAVDGVNGGKEVKPGSPVTGTAAETMTENEDKEEFNLDEILREMEADDAEGSSSIAESEKIATENVELKRSLREHRDVIQFMRSKLQEMNMLNAKLLFTNKLFKSFEMNPNQKLHIVETFDRATTVREVKLIYTTLAESFNGKTSGAAKQKSTARNITEGMASKPIGSTKPKTQVLAEGNELVTRMQKLAGITR